MEDPSTHELFLTSLSILGHIFGAAVLYWILKIKSRLDRSVKSLQQNLNKGNPHNTEANIELELRIRSILAECLGRTDSDSVQFWAFFNGSYYVAGNPQLRLRLIQEVTGTGILPQSRKNMEFFLAEILDPLKETMDTGVSVISSIRNLPVIGEFQIANGFKHSILVRVQNSQQNFVGVIWLNFRDPLDAEFIDTLLDSLKNYASRISYLLDSFTEEIAPKK